MHRQWATIWIAISVLASGAILAEEPVSIPSRTQELIERLGHEEFAEREQAGEELLEIGFPAYKELEAATSHVDREIRYRAERLLVRIREADLARRLELFLEGKDETTEYPIPGWSAFEKSFGDTRDTREFYVAMQKADGEILERIENDSKGLPDFLAQRATQIQQNMQFQKTQLTDGQVNALIFAGTQCKLPQQPMAIIQSFCYQQGFRDAITSSGAKKELTRKLLGSWIERTEDAAAYQAMMLAMQYDLTEGLTPARKILDAGNQQPYIQQFAILSIAKFGKPEDVPLIEKSLENVTVVNNSTINGKRRQTQLRDVALASLIYLAKQKPKDFGFADLQEAAPYLFNVSTLGFEDDAKREEALKKWKAYAKDKTLPTSTDAEGKAGEAKKVEDQPAAAQAAEEAKARAKQGAALVPVPIPLGTAIEVQILPAPVPVAPAQK